MATGTGFLRVAAADRPPFVFVDPARIGNARFYGLLVDLLPVLLSYGAGTADNTTLQYYAVNGSGGQLQPNGTWSGIMGELAAGRADIAAFPLSIVLPRPDYADLTYSYYNGGIGILVSAKQEGADALAFLKPFSWRLWLSILAAMLGVAIACTLLSHLSPLGRFEVRRLRRLDVEQDYAVSEYVVASANESSLVDAAATQLGQMPLPRSRSWALRLIVLAYGAFAIIVLSSYTANLAAFLTVARLTPTVDSTLTLLRSSGKFAVSAGGSTQAYFKNALDPVAAALAPRMVPFNSTDVAVAAVRSGDVAAYLTDAATLQYYATSAPCDITTSGQPFGPNALAFGLPKNSTLTPSLNRALLEVQSNGVLDQLVRKWTIDIDQCHASSQAETYRLDVTNLVGLFYMLLLAMALAALIAAMERLVPHVLHASPQLDERVRRMRAAGRRLVGVCLPGCCMDGSSEAGEYVPDTSLSRSTLDISRSFNPRPRGKRGGTAAAAAAAVAAVDGVKSMDSSVSSHSADHMSGKVPFGGFGAMQHHRGGRGENADGEAFAVAGIMSEQRV